MAALKFLSDNSDSDAELKINTEYAKIYNNFRQKEELHKCKYNPNFQKNTEGKILLFILNSI